MLYRNDMTIPTHFNDPTLIYLFIILNPHIRF